MNPLFEAAVEVCQVMQSHGWRFCIIGGLAVQKWGEARTTLDVDLSLLAPFGDEEEFVTTLLKRFRARTSDAAEFAMMNRVLLLAASNGTDVDVALAALPFEEEM